MQRGNRSPGAINGVGATSSTTKCLWIIQMMAIHLSWNMIQRHSGLLGHCHQMQPTSLPSNWSPTLISMRRSFLFSPLCHCVCVCVYMFFPGLSLPIGCNKETNEMERWWWLTVYGLGWTRLGYEERSLMCSAHGYLFLFLFLFLLNMIIFLYIYRTSFPSSHPITIQTMKSLQKPYSSFIPPPLLYIVVSHLIAILFPFCLQIFTQLLPFLIQL